MRNFYLFLLAVFTGCIILFIGSFLYLDSQKRNTYHYVMSLNGYDIGTIKIDRFVTEDKILYKSVSEIPFNPILTSDKIRMVFNREYALESYLNEKSGSGAAETLSIQNDNGRVSYVAIAKSRFQSLSGIPVRQPIFVFDDEAPVTYLPIIENYNFRRGRAQGFNAIMPSRTLLPPMKRFVTLTSIRNEYMKVEGHRIKTECLLLKIKNYPQGTVWVSRSDRSIIMIDLPNAGIRIRRVFSPRKIEASEYAPEQEGFTASAVSFSNKSIKLAGTIYLPKGDGKYPGIILIPGDGNETGSYRGLFSSMAAVLAKNGFAALTFDRRGMGSSEGDSSSATDADAIGDIDAAVDLMKARKDIDPERIALIGHAKGCFYSSVIAARRNDIRAVILISPKASFGIRQGSDFSSLNELAARYGWSDEYLKTAMKSQVETFDKTRGATHSRVSILRKRCFADKMREELSENPLAEAGKIKAPVLILQGKEDTVPPGDSAPKIEKAVEEGGNKDHTLMYFGYLGFYPGTNVIDGSRKIHYLIDQGIADAGMKWLKEHLAEQPQNAIEAPVAPTDTKN